MSTSALSLLVFTACSSPPPPSPTGPTTAHSLLTIVAGLLPVLQLVAFGALLVRTPPTADTRPQRRWR